MLEDKEIKVLVVDDSILFRETLSKMLSEKRGITVVGTAGDAYEASEKIVQLQPDVVTLDFEMPKMNGIEFLKRLIPQYPVPVIVVSSMTINVFEALSVGAVDFIKKPTVKSPRDLMDFSYELGRKITAANGARVIQKTASALAPKSVAAAPAQATVSASTPITYRNKDLVIALGASTGGPDALQTVLQGMPANSPPIIITQHMPAGFTKMYAERMNRCCAIEVKEAVDGDVLRPGLAIIAAGDYHLQLKKNSTGYYVSSRQGERVSGHCPSVDVMFTSVAEVAGKNAIGAILTGMGADGAKGLLLMRKAGAYTIGQDEATCVVYGMPMVAFTGGAVCQQAPLGKIADIINKRVSQQ